MTLDETLATLHPTQRAAVTHPARPLLLACGPGSGKTRILTHRIQWLVQQERVAPTAILALTFSRAASDELRGRLFGALGPLARELWTGTFHGFGAWLLRRHGARLGRTAAFTIFDREDTRRLIGRLLEELGLEGDLATLVEAVERADDVFNADQLGILAVPIEDDALGELLRHLVAVVMRLDLHLHAVVHEMEAVEVDLQLIDRRGVLNHGRAQADRNRNR